MLLKNETSRNREEKAATDERRYYTDLQDQILFIRGVSVFTRGRFLPRHSG
jgi:hypothetical protein